MSALAETFLSFVDTTVGLASSDKAFSWVGSSFLQKDGTQGWDVNAQAPLK